MVEKNNFVRILRKESYWFNTTGVVISVEKQQGILYPIVVRFISPNYNGVNTANFARAELTLLSPHENKKNV